MTVSTHAGRSRVVLVLALLMGSCSGSGDETTPTSWGEAMTVSELAAVLIDPAAATDCELDPSGYVDLACGFRSVGAAEVLGERGDPAAVPALMAAISNPDTYHDAAEASWEALERIGGPEVIAGLVEWITLGSPGLSGEIDGGRIVIADRAARMLGRLGGVEHNQLLVDAGVAYEACSGSGYSDALVMINQADATPLLQYLESSDTDWVYGPLIRIGQPGTEDALIAPLAEGRASTPMAECLLNSGNPRLEQAAEEWAAARGLMISRLPGFSTGWGSG